MRTSCVKNGLVMVVILLFVGVAVQTSIATVQPESIDVEYFDVEIEFIGLGKNYTTQLTTEEIEELNSLFDSIYVKIQNSKSYCEVIEIFKKTVLRLNNYGLLGDVGKKKTLELVTNSYHKRIFLETLGEIYDKKGLLVEDENRFCLIAGKSSDTMFWSPWRMGIVFFMAQLFDVYPGTLAYWTRIIAGIDFLIPLCLGRWIEIYYTDFYSWIITFGLNGLKYWDGYLTGMLEPLGFPDIGVIGFTGLKIGIFIIPHSYYIGYARQVSVKSY